MRTQTPSHLHLKMDGFVSRDGGLLGSQNTLAAKKYAAKEQIFAQGDAATNIYEVVSGCVKLMRCLSDGRQQIVGFFFADDIIGLTAGAVYTYAAIAVTPTKIRTTKKLDVLRRLTKDDALGENVVRLASDELAAAHDQMTLLGCKRPLEKVASFITAMSRKSSIYDDVSRQVYLPMTQTDMGSYLGLALETVCRSFCALKKQGIVSDIDRHFIRIDNIEALLELADIASDSWTRGSVEIMRHAS